MAKSPIVSVICAAYNSERFLAASIDSILNQDFKDFEFIIFNDGATDGTGKILEDYKNKDHRIVVVHQDNAGLTVTLNRALQLARGRYIARQDDDDLSHSSRLSLQQSYLSDNPHCVLAGSRYQSINENNQLIGASRVPMSSSAIRRSLITHNVVAHSSAMFRREEVLKVGGYDEQFRTAQDYALWCRLALEYDVVNLKPYLVQRRRHRGQIGMTRSAEQLKNRNVIRRNYRADILSGKYVASASVALRMKCHLFNWLGK